MRKKNKWEDDRFQCAEACAVDDVKDFASVFIEKVLTASPAASPFFMVYREGGRHPTFRHSNIESARTEANRIRRESGDTTHVLGVVETQIAHARPTVEEVRRHGSEHPIDGHGSAYQPTSLWRVVHKFGDIIPSIVGVRVEGENAQLRRHAHYVCS